MSPSVVPATRLLVAIFVASLIGGFVLLSRRPYGNTFNGANRQLWLAAVDTAPQAGKDPSHPAFYVTGQDLDSTNERPQFTVNPCKPLGQTCENGYDCCDGYCRAGSDGKLDPIRSDLMTCGFSWKDGGNQHLRKNARSLAGAFFEVLAACWFF